VLLFESTSRDLHVEWTLRTQIKTLLDYFLYATVVAVNAHFKNSMENDRRIELQLQPIHASSSKSPVRQFFYETVYPDSV
jgi:hypothetical protein